MSPIRLFWLLLLGCPSALAAATSDDGYCRNGVFGVDNPSPGLGLVVGKERTYFIDDMQGCPSAAPSCRLKSYLVAGDHVVTGRSRGRYLCVYFPGKGGGSAGWVESARIRPLAVRRDPPVLSWLGQWSDEGNPRVRFRLRQGRLIAEGEAAWPSFDPSPEDAPGGPHVGEIDEPVTTSGNRAFAKECEIGFTLLGDMLVAADPKMQCGGVNVSFTGVYRRVGAVGGRLKQA